MNCDHVTAIACSQCGAPVTVPTGQHTVACQHCGHVTRVATATATARDDLVEQQTVEAEARAALGYECLRLAKLRAAEVGVVTCCIVAIPTIVAAFAEHYGLAPDEPFATLMHITRVAFGLLGLLAGMAAWLVLWRPSSVQARAHAHLTKATSGPQRTVSGKCPHCGAPLRLDGSDATPRCQHCGTQLWVAFGRFIEWTADAGQRAKRWQDVARETYFRVELPSFRLYFIGTLAFCVLYAVIASLAALVELLT